MVDPHEPRPGRGARSFIVPALIALAIVAMLVLHLTGVVGPAH